MWAQPPITVINQDSHRYSHRPIWCGKFSTWGSFFPGSYLDWVKLTIKIEQGRKKTYNKRACRIPGSSRSWWMSVQNIRRSGTMDYTILNSEYMIYSRPSAQLQHYIKKKKVIKSYPGYVTKKYHFLCDIRYQWPCFNSVRTPKVFSPYLPPPLVGWKQPDYCYLALILFFYSENEWHPHPDLHYIT